jgi:hypothetical protein
MVVVADKMDLKYPTNRISTGKNDVTISQGRNEG